MIDLSKVTAIYFDFDGVLADTEMGRYLAYGEILKRYGIDIKDRFRFEDIVGLTGKAVIDKYLPDFPVQTRAAIINERYAEYTSHLDRYCIPYPGVQDALRRIKSKGYFFALTTANATANSGILLEHVGVRQYFDAIYGLEYCENPITRKKDYGRLAETTGRSTEECIVIEDSPVGVEGAKKSGYYTIAFQRVPHPSLNRYADLIVNDYDELLKFFFN